LTIFSTTAGSVTAGFSLSTFSLFGSFLMPPLLRLGCLMMTQNC
jgi:hypothetical protein